MLNYTLQEIPIYMAYVKCFICVYMTNSPKLSFLDLIHESVGLVASFSNINFLQRFPLQFLHYTFPVRSMVQLKTLFDNFFDKWKKGMKFSISFEKRPLWVGGCLSFISFGWYSAKCQRISVLHTFCIWNKHRPAWYLLFISLIVSLFI